MIKGVFIFTDVNIPITITVTGLDALTGDGDISITATDSVGNARVITLTFTVAEDPAVLVIRDLPTDSLEGVEVSALHLITDEMYSDQSIKAAIKALEHLDVIPDNDIHITKVTTGNQSITITITYGGETKVITLTGFPTLEEHESALLEAAKDSAKGFVNGLDYPTKDDGAHNPAYFDAIDEAKQKALQAIDAATTPEQAHAIASSSTEGSGIVAIIKAIDAYVSTTGTTAIINSVVAGDLRNIPSADSHRLPSVIPKPGDGDTVSRVHYTFTG